MKKTALLCAATLTLLLGAACEKIIEFKGEQTEPRLTISSQAEVGKPLEVYVASSIFFLSDTGAEMLSLRSSSLKKGRCAAS